jgi:hypothetical protein
VSVSEDICIFNLKSRQSEKHVIKDIFHFGQGSIFSFPAITAMCTLTEKDGYTASPEFRSVPLSHCSMVVLETSNASAALACVNPHWSRQRRNDVALAGFVVGLIIRAPSVP